MRIEHRFRTPDGDEIGVLPIDPASKPSYEIRFGTGDRIRAVGLAEAIVHAIPIDVGKRRVPVAPVCLLIASKVYLAASEIRPHDLGDACNAMEAYEREGVRRFDVDYDFYPNLNFETAGAFLAGLDVAAALPTEPLRMVDEAAEALTQDRRLGNRYDRGEARLALVLAFREGLRAASK